MQVMHQLRRAARHLGVEAQRADVTTVWRLRLPALLERLGIDFVLDVGANDGGFASELLENGYRGRVLSFEPLPDAWEKLRARAARVAPTQWTVWPPIALSDENGEAEFFETVNSVSSSLLPATDELIRTNANCATTKSHKVHLRKLDDLIAEMDMGASAYLKLDVQGAEGKVLAGAEKALRGPIKGIQMEMSLVSLYQGQMLADDLHGLMRSAGFELWDIVPEYRDAASLRLLQYDGVYIRKD